MKHLISDRMHKCISETTCPEGYLVMRAVDFSARIAQKDQVSHEETGERGEHAPHRFHWTAKRGPHTAVTAGSSLAVRKRKGV